MNQNRAPKYPRKPAILDGSEAVACVETRLSEAGCVYPITPPTTMATLCQAARGAARELVEVGA